MTFKKGGKFVLKGLKQRTDLNGEVVTLLKWNKKHGRWEVRCDDGELIRVLEKNLGQSPDAEGEELLWHVPQLHPCIGETLNKFVRGGNDLPPIMEGIPQLGSGQISRGVFEVVAKIATKLYGDPSPDWQISSDRLVLSMLLDYIGKEGDSRLVIVKLQSKADDFFHPRNIGILLPAALPKFDTAAEYCALMNLMRQRSVDFIRSHQTTLARIVSMMKGSKLTSNRSDPSTIMQMLMCGKDDNKSVKRASLREELCFAGMYEDGDSWNRIYLAWVFEDLLETLSPSDAQAGGSLGEWHRLQGWERQLTKAVECNSIRFYMNVADDFDLGLWMTGFVELDLSVLLDIPGVDTDRRIIRLAFFAELVWQFSLQSGVWDKIRQAGSNIPVGQAPKATFDNADLDDGGMTTSTVEDKDDLKIGKKIEVIGVVENDNSCVCSGMEGFVVGQVDEDHYSIQFTNLAAPQTLHVSQLQRATKVRREKHKCGCGRTGDFLCAGCNMTWYCGPECQQADYKTHKVACKAIGGSGIFMEAMWNKTTPSHSVD